MNSWIETVAAGQTLQREQIITAVAWLSDPEAGPELKADFLDALQRKGETPEEIAGFALELRERSLPLPLASDFATGREILDVCGTGGDRLNTFNISTTVALVCAAAGVVVAKHGNRAITSRSGSADVLEALGIAVEFSPEAAADSLARHDFAFLFAPRFHPAFRGIGPARRLCAQRGGRTIFNYLGPLLNPVRPTVQLLGVSHPELTGPLARALEQMGLRRAQVVCGHVPRTPGPTAYLDELSTLGPNTIAEFHHQRASSQSEWAPTDFPLTPATIEDLAGGDAAENARIIEQILRGEIRGPKLEAVLLNAGAALFLAGKSRSITEGWSLAEEVIQSGQASRKLEILRSARA